MIYDTNEITVLSTSEISGNLTYVRPPGSLNINSEIEEETKHNRLLNTELGGNNEELFKHLSYLSQLSQDVSKHQHVDQPGPGEYKIKLFDSSSASPASAFLQEHRFNTPSKQGGGRTTSLTEDLDALNTMKATEASTPNGHSSTRGRSRMSVHFNRHNSEVKRPVTMRLESGDGPLTPLTPSEVQNHRLSKPLRSTS